MKKATKEKSNSSENSFDKKENNYEILPSISSSVGALESELVYKINLMNNNNNNNNNNNHNNNNSHIDIGNVH
eukprot:Pgem_evm1s17641